MELARPAKCIISTVNLEFIQYIMNVISTCFSHSNNTDNTLFESRQSKKRYVFHLTVLISNPGTVLVCLQTGSLVNFGFSMDQLLDSLSGIGVVNFKSVQIVVALQAENKDHSKSILIHIISLFV